LVPEVLRPRGRQFDFCCEREERTWIQSGASSRDAAVQQFKGSKVQGNIGLFEPELNGTYALRDESEAYGSDFTVRFFSDG
jgi:hypothetical protein